ncbi:Gag protease polyprotein [Cucumis melo var. makuwa]|uniref:Gag protease polyprotein n=1 Tax=Cucumis melo var. makuwa TaxID=1194695 RepID=A0A5D3DL58_CUCMM|nr:Gag protease polyprotein [Cucumis melo var. makuwa]TYK24366.1 Gag protease polyprotein [Cucumis melo var. makuwa]
MQGPTQGPSIGESSTLRVRGEAGNEQFARIAQEIGRLERAEPSDPEKAYGIERLKKLRATVFEGSTDPPDAENWLNMLEKCFDVMNCPEERKVRLTTFLLQKEAEGWWKSILARCSDTRALDWQTFRGIFEDKYYPSTYCKAKRDEFMGCQRFERGSRFEIRTPVTAIAKWMNFSQLVETALLVEQSITKEKSAVELSHGTSTASGFRGREGISMLVDLLPLELQRLDVILGMDFLFAHYASMNCHRKEVVFRKPGFAEVVFRGIRKVISRSLISVLKAEKLLRKGCTAFLVHIVVEQREKLKPEDVPVVKEFHNVFPDDLSGLPLDREIEFTIELLP